MRLVLPTLQVIRVHLLSCFASPSCHLISHCTTKAGWRYHPPPYPSHCDSIRRTNCCSAEPYRQTPPTMCWPTFSPPSGSGMVVQVEERRQRYAGEPRNRRLRLVNERERASDEWRLVSPSRGSHRSGSGSEQWQHQPQHVDHVPHHPGQYDHGNTQTVWPQWHPQQPAHHQQQMGYPQQAQLPFPGPHHHQQHHPPIQVINEHEFVAEDDHHHHPHQPQVEMRAPMPQHLQAHHRGGGLARSQSRGHHGRHDRYRDSSSSSDEESYGGGRKRSGRVLVIEDDDSFDDLRPPVRRWRRRSSSHRSGSRRRR